MNAEEIARFLRSHPQFFDQYPELLESILVPHPYGGRAIPLAERQAVALRDKARLLEGRLGELIRFGEENDAISEKVQRLAVALVGARGGRRGRGGWRGGRGLGGGGGGGHSSVRTR